MNACWRHRLTGRIIGLTLGAVIPTLFIAIFNSNWRMLGEFFLYSLTYSLVIGTLAFTVVPYSWPRYLRLAAPWNWIFRFGVLLAVAGSGTLLACAFLRAIGLIKPGGFWSSYIVDVKIASLITLIAGTAITVYENMRAQLEQTTLELRTKELERERALQLATQARLNSLESRIHPHFLFNALNSISALIPEDPARAERLIERMAGLLRFSLDSEQNGLVPLEREMKIVADYLEIERARYGERLRYRVEVPPELAQTLIPPLSIQTLVENSVKYVVAPNRSGGEIRIQGELPAGALRVSVSDSGPGFDLESAPAGHGIDNLRSRLQALFGGAARLTIDRAPERSTVAVLIPQNGVS